MNDASPGREVPSGDRSRRGGGVLVRKRRPRWGDRRESLGRNDRDGWKFGGHDGCRGHGRTDDRRDRRHAGTIRRAFRRRRGGHGWASVGRRGRVGVHGDRRRRCRRSGQHRRNGRRRRHRGRWRNGFILSLPDERQRLQDPAVRRFHHARREVNGRWRVSLAFVQVDRGGQTEDHVCRLGREWTGQRFRPALSTQSRGTCRLDHRSRLQHALQQLQRDLEAGSEPRAGSEPQHHPADDRDQRSLRQGHGGYVDAARGASRQDRAERTQRAHRAGAAHAARA